MSVTDEVKSRLDIVAYVQKHVPALKKAGRNYKAPCPFHAEKTPSFIVNPERGSWHCFGACAEGGDIFTFAQKFHGWDFREALRELANEAGVPLRRQTEEQKTASDRRDRQRGMLASAAEFYQRELKRERGAAAMRYLRQERGLQPETIETFQLGFAPAGWDFMLGSLRALDYADDEIVEAGLALRNDAGRIYDRFRNRLIFPIRDERGRVVGFGGRALDPADSAKYINSPSSPLFEKNRLLYGFDMGRRDIRDSGSAVIVEGYMDVIQAHQAGYRNVVAQMGTAMTERQMRLIAPRHAKRVVLALDADEAGQNATRRSLEVARQTLAQDYAGKLSVDIAVLQIPAGKDPDDFLRATPAAWPGLVERAQSVADFVIELETRSLSASASLGEREEIARQTLPILTASENRLYRQENLQKLARRLRMSERDLLAWAGNSLPAPAAPATPPAAPADLPPEYWENEYDAPPPDDLVGEESGDATSATRSGPRARLAIEPYCLSLLLGNPNLLADVNRKLSELAEGDADLLRGPLCEFGSADFSQTAYRVLMARFVESLAQHERPPLEYLSQAVDEALRREYDALFVETQEALAQSVNRNFEVDLNDIVKRKRYASKPGLSPQDELIGRALQLRLARLEKERLEMQYLQEEAQTGAAEALDRGELQARILLSMRAKARINAAVGRETRFFAAAPAG